MTTLNRKDSPGARAVEAECKAALAALPEAAIKPCPHCKGAAVVVEDSEGFAMGCKTVGCFAELLVDSITVWWIDRADMVAAWNRRAQ